MLIESDDPAPVEIINPQGRSPFLLIGDHAGRRIPARLGDLGLPDAERARHIGWDIGVAALGERLAAMLDAPFVRQVYSRLVVDCNRAHDAADLIPAISDGTIVPGNRGLDDGARAERLAAIHEPYHRAIAAALAPRRATWLVALHSFTPRMGGADRPWRIGILHHLGDTRFAHACLAALRRDPALSVGDNEPYRMDGTDYTIPRHAYAAALPYVEIEVRQDLLADDAGIAAQAALIAEMLAAAQAAVAAEAGRS